MDRMPLTQDDLRELHAPLLRALLLIAVGTGALAFAWHRHETAEAGYRQAVGALKTQTLPPAQAALMQQARAIMTAENRPAWADQAHRAGAAPMDVEWLPRRVLHQGPGFALVANPMHLSLHPKHEEEILHLIDQLQSFEGALVRPTRCIVQRPSADILKPLEAECWFDWIRAERQP